MSTVLNEIASLDAGMTILSDAGHRWPGTSELLRSAALFDVYTGEPIPPGKKNLTYSLAYQSQDRTLTDAEVNTLQDGIVRALHEKFGAVLR